MNNTDRMGNETNSNSNSILVDSIRVVNTDRRITEAVVKIEDIEIRMLYNDMIDKNKGFKTIRDSLINAGYPMDEESIVKLYDWIVKCSIEYEYSTVYASKDKISLFEEHTASASAGNRKYNGDKIVRQGAFENQKGMFDKLLANNAGSTVLAASIAGMLNKVLGLVDSQQIVNVVGKSSTGKTTLCSGLEAVFGNREYKVSDNTDLGLAKLLGNNDFLPLYADDFMARYISEKKTNAVAALRKLIMMLSTSQTKSTALKDAVKFSGSLIMTSETSIVDAMVSENSGIMGDAYRFIEIPVDTSFFKSLDNVKEYNRLMGENKGWFGDMVAEYIMKNYQLLRKEYEILYKNTVELLNDVKISNDIQPVRCANRVTSLAISFYVAAKVNGTFDINSNRMNDFLKYLVDIEREQLAKYVVVSIEDKFRAVLSQDYDNLGEVIGSDCKISKYDGVKHIDQRYDGDVDVNGSIITVRMTKEIFKTYLKNRKFDEKNVIDMLRNNRTSDTSKVKALGEGRSSRIDRKCSDLGKRMVVIEFQAA